MGGVATNKRILLKLSLSGALYELIWVKEVQKIGLFKNWKRVRKFGQQK